MPDRYSALASHSNWWADNANSLAKLNYSSRAWVNDKGSLTAALMGLSDGDFEVNLLKQGIALPYFHEQRKLGRPLSKAAMIREVELKIFGQAVVYARSVVPLKLVLNGRNGLANLGRTPLGHLLFKDGNIRVSKRDFAICDHGQRQIVARRTPYDYQHSRVLVSEFFLPRFYEFLKQ